MTGLPEFQPPRTAAAQDESWERHGDNHYARMVDAYVFAATLERELLAARSGAAPAPSEALAAHAIEELHQLGYTVRDGALIPPDNLHELARVAGFALSPPAAPADEMAREGAT